MFKKIFLFLILFSLIFHNKLYANNNIAYMDLDYVINNSIIGQKILKQLNNINSQNIENLKKEQSKLKKEIEEINKIKNIASEEDFKKKVTLHNQNVKAYENLKKKLSNDLTQKKNNEMKELVKLINSLLEDYLKKNSIDILLNKEIVYFAKDKYDISKAILELTNNKYK